MRFTKYYSNLIKASGVLHLEVKQFQTIMNIIFLECQIKEQEVIGKHLSGDAKVMLGKRSYMTYNKLNNLTQGKKPKELFKSIVRGYED